jgi:hypothetical protein
MFLRISYRIDFDKRIARVFGILLDINDLIVVNQEHLILGFFTRFLRLLFFRELGRHLRHTFAFRDIYFGNVLTFPLDVDQRILLLYVASRVGAADQKSECDQEREPAAKSFHPFPPPHAIISRFAHPRDCHFLRLNRTGP